MAAPAPVALITGAGRGIGRVLAQSYSAAGYRVAITGRTVEPLEETAALVRDAGGTVLVVPGDVRDEAACAELVAATVGELGQLDVLLNNAAVPGTDMGVADMELANW